MIDSSVPQTIVDRLLRPNGVEIASRVPAGMSGATVFRCQRGSGDPFALRCWPQGTSRGRIDAVRRVVVAARQNGCQLVPRLDFGNDTVIGDDNDRWWELAEWMPGTALPVDASPLAVLRGVIAIARFHASVQRLGTFRQPPPAVTARLSRIREIQQLIPRLVAGNLKIVDSHPELASVVRDACGLIRWKWHEVSPEITQSLTQYLELDLPTQFVLRDVHRGNVLFDGDVPAGLIDFDAVRVDTPMSDLARWLSSFVFETTQRNQLWSAALAGYFENSTLLSHDSAELHLSVAQVIGRSNRWISLVNWLIWLGIEHRMFPAGPEAVAKRIRELLILAIDDN